MWLVIDTAAGILKHASSHANLPTLQTDAHSMYVTFYLSGTVRKIWMDNHRDIALTKMTPFTLVTIILTLKIQT